MLLIKNAFKQNKPSNCYKYFKKRVDAEIGLRHVRNNNEKVFSFKCNKTRIFENPSSLSYNRRKNSKLQAINRKIKISHFTQTRNPVISTKKSDFINKILREKENSNKCSGRQVSKTIKTTFKQVKFI